MVNSFSTDPRQSRANRTVMYKKPLESDVLYQVPVSKTADDLSGTEKNISGKNQQ